MKFKKFLAYLFIILFPLKETAEALNCAETAEELDDRIFSIVGIKK